MLLVCYCCWGLELQFFKPVEKDSFLIMKNLFPFCSNLCFLQNIGSTGYSLKLNHVRRLEGKSPTDGGVNDTEITFKMTHLDMRMCAYSSK